VERDEVNSFSLTGGSYQQEAQSCLVLSLPGSPARWAGSFNIQGQTTVSGSMIEIRTMANIIRPEQKII
jgi:hypothetical protein